MFDLYNIFYLVIVPVSVKYILTYLTYITYLTYLTYSILISHQVYIVFIVLCKMVFSLLAAMSF